MHGCKVYVTPESKYEKNKDFKKLVRTPIQFLKITGGINQKTLKFWPPNRENQLSQNFFLDEITPN